MGFVYQMNIKIGISDSKSLAMTHSRDRTQNWLCAFLLLSLYLCLPNFHKLKISYLYSALN